MLEGFFAPRFCRSCEVLSLDPPLVLMHDFIKESECGALMKVAEDSGIAGFVGSTVRGSQEEATNVRTSSTAWLNPANMAMSKPVLDILRRIDEKVGAICGVPRQNLESLQCVRYQEGQRYDYHIDTIEQYNSYPCGGRLASCLLFLNEDFEGGETHFLELDVRVKPRTGSALFWFNCHLPFFMDTEVLDGSQAERDLLAAMRPDERSLHAGLPVLGGTKYAANKWVHATRFAPKSDGIEGG